MLPVIFFAFLEGFIVLKSLLRVYLSHLIDYIPHLGQGTIQFNTNCILFWHGILYRCPASIYISCSNALNLSVSKSINLNMTEMNF